MRGCAGVRPGTLGPGNPCRGDGGLLGQQYRAPVQSLVTQIDALELFRRPTHNATFPRKDSMLLETV